MRCPTVSTRLDMANEVVNRLSISNADKIVLVMDNLNTHTIA